jgi:hypothetical protein
VGFAKKASNFIRFGERLWAIRQILKDKPNVKFSSNQPLFLKIKADPQNPTLKIYPQASEFSQILQIGNSTPLSSEYLRMLSLNPKAGAQKIKF